MSQPIDTIHFNIAFYDGQAEGDVGYSYYVASAQEAIIVTDGRTLDELLYNIREALALYLDEPDTISLYNIVPKPRILITMELPNAEVA